MTIYDFPLTNGTIDQLIVSTQAEVPFFIPMMLLFVFFFVVVAGSSAQAARGRDPNIQLWFTLAGLTTFLLTLMFSITAGIVSVTMLSITFGITILSAVWLYLSNQ